MITIILFVAVRQAPRLLTRNHDIGTETPERVALSEKVAVVDEQARRAPREVVVIDGRHGTGGRSGFSGEFASAGGEVTLIATGSASSRAPGAVLEVNVQLDGKTVGTLKIQGSESGRPKPFPTAVLAAGIVPEGHHTVRVVPANAWTLTDADDAFSVTAVETGPSGALARPDSGASGITDRHE